MGDAEKANLLKSTFVSEAFPDGTYEVPLIGMEGEALGTVNATFKEGFWNCTLAIDNVEAMNKLGVDLVFVHSFNQLSENATVVVAKKREEK